jgi:hypothetical protein
MRIMEQEDYKRIEHRLIASQTFIEINRSGLRPGALPLDAEERSGRRRLIAIGAGHRVVAIGCAGWNDEIELIQSCEPVQARESDGRWSARNLADRQSGQRARLGYRVSRQLRGRQPESDCVANDCFSR